MTPTAPAGPHGARLKRWLQYGGAAIVLIGGLWLVIQLTSPAPRGGRGSPSLAEIKLTGETRATSLEGLAAQLDTARGENAQLRQDVARLEGQIGKALEGVRGAFERQLASSQNRSAAELERERSRLARELEGLQGAVGSNHTPPQSGAAQPELAVRDGRSPWATSTPDRIAFRAAARRQGGWRRRRQRPAAAPVRRRRHSRFRFHLCDRASPRRCGKYPRHGCG